MKQESIRRDYHIGPLKDLSQIRVVRWGCAATAELTAADLESRVGRITIPVYLTRQDIVNLQTMTAEILADWPE